MDGLRRGTGVLIAALAAIGPAAGALAQGLDTESVEDAGATTVVRLVVLTLVILGLALAGVTVWFWRTTRPDHPALGPLEVLSDRRFPHLDVLEQQRRLDSARPEGAEPAPRRKSVVAAAERQQKLAAELQELVEGTPEGFDDLDVEPVADLSPPSVRVVATPDEATGHAGPEGHRREVVDSP